MRSSLADRTKRFTALAFGLAFLMSTQAFGQAGADELARRHFESGAAYFEQAEYEEALQAFQKAYELSGRHQILRNISVVQERLGNLAGAVAALDEFLEEASNDPAADTMRTRRDNLRLRLEKQRESEPTKETEADPTPPDPGIAEENAPPRRTPEEREAAGLPPEEYLLKDEPNRVPAYILLSVGGLAGAGALLTGVVAKIEHDELTTTCKPNCTESQVATGESLALTSTVLTGVAVVGIGAGLIWLLTADSGQESSAGPSATPRLAVSVFPGNGYAEAAWRF